MITAMLLEIIIPDLVTMLNTQEMFDSLVADSVEVLQSVALMQAVATI
jgi:predicted component of type VI protein secretion system